MKVLTIINALGPGGAETLVLDLARWISSCSSPPFAMELCTLYPLTGPVPEMDEIQIPWHRWELIRRWDPRALARLWALVRERRYDVIHVHLFPSIYFAGVLARIEKRPVYILSEHSTYNFRRKHFLRGIEKWIYGAYDRIIAVGQEVALSLGRWLPEVKGAVTVLPNAVTLPPVPAGRRALEKMLCVANLFPWKGLDVLVKAIRILHDQGLKVHLDIVGEGPIRQELAAQIANEGLDGWVRLLGKRSRREISRLMAEKGTFVLSSRREGLPMALLEAMAHAMVVVATGVGDIPKVVENGVNGLLVAPGQPQELARALGEVMRKPERARAMAWKAREQIEESFAMEAYAMALRDIYAGLCSEK